MDRMRRTFSEIEHPGDLQNVEDMLQEHKAHIIDVDTDYSAESATITWEVANKAEFLAAVKDNDLYNT